MSKRKQFATERKTPRSRLVVAETALAKIQEGDADEVVVTSKKGKRIYTLRDTFLANILQYTTEGIYVVDTKLRCTYINSAALSLLGHTEAECLGMNMHTLTHYKHADGSRYLERDCSIFRSLKTGATTRLAEEAIWRKNGTSFTALYSCSPLYEEDKISGVAVVIFDISDRKVAEEKLRQSEERYRAFVSQSSEGIWRFELEKPVSIKHSSDKQIDHFYKYSYLAECNDAMAQMYGFQAASDITGARLQDLMPRKKNEGYLRSFIASGYKLTNAESQEVGKDGAMYCFQNNIVGIIENNMLLRAWGIQRDITRAKEIEQRKDDYLSIASHELKTPITSLKLYNELLQQKLASLGHEEVVGFVERMDNQIDKLAKLVNDLLDVSRIQSGKLTYQLERFRIADLIKEVSDDMQKAMKQHALIVKAKTQKEVMADKNRIGQVLINLIENAIKYSPKSDKILVTAKNGGNAVVVQIQDFGIGVPLSEQQRIFERFYRIDGKERNIASGQGLGLYISSEIVKRHGGKIWVESKERKGSIFSFTLPLKNQRRSPGSLVLQ